MILYLTYEPPDGPPKTIWLKPSQTLVVGRGPNSDLNCPFDPRLSPTHFQLQFEDSGWTVRTLSSLAVYVDDRPAGSSVQMDDCHSIRAGDTVFQIRIEGGRRRVARAPASVEPEPPSKPRIPLTWTQTNPTTLCIKVDPASIEQLLSSLCQNCNLYALVNQLRLKQPIKGLAITGQDLLENAPEEIRVTDSLFLCSIDRAKLVELAEPLIQASRADAVTLIGCKLSPEQIQQELKILWAWYSRPSLLAFHLQQGSKFMTEKLLAHPESIIVAQAPGQDQLLAFAASDRIDNLQAVLGKLATPEIQA